MHPIGPNIGCRTESNSTFVSSNWKLINTGRGKKKNGNKDFWHEIFKIFVCFRFKVKNIEKCEELKSIFLEH